MRLRKRLAAKKLRLKLWLATDENRFLWWLLAQEDEEFAAEHGKLF